MLGVAGVLIAATARGGPAHESFSTALNGWTNPPSTTAWRWTNGVAQAVFVASPVPATATLTAGELPASSAFLGDYTSDGIALIGFSFRALNTLPSTLTLRLLAGTNGIFQNLQAAVPATGVWVRLVLPLDTRTGSGWSGVADDAAFTAVLAAIDDCSLSVTKPATVVPVRFEIDDVFIDFRPELLASAPGPGDPLVWRATYLRTNAAYGIETATAVTGPWIRVESLIATNRTLAGIFTNTAAATGFHRLVAP
jgi:hypothetical protein